MLQHIPAPHLLHDEECLSRQNISVSLCLFVSNPLASTASIVEAVSFDLTEPKLTNPLRLSNWRP